MPGQDGYDLIRAIRERERRPGGEARLPAIALTAFARTQDRDVAIAAGFDEHCGKPLRPHDLIASIARLTAAAHR
jgi:CheY-like chemotaxis protein